MIVYYAVVREGEHPDQRKPGRAWTNCKTVKEGAELAIHQAARNGWRGRAVACAWTDKMAEAGHAYALVVDISDDSPPYERPDPRNSHTRARVQYANHPCWNTP